MRGLRRAAALALILVLVALAVSPTVAAPGGATPKTNEAHESWLVMDPVPATTEATSVTLSGKVAGNFDMKVVNGSFVKEFAAVGYFTVEVALFAGENRIQLSGIDRAGRLLNYSAAVTTPIDDNQEASELLVEVGQNTLVANGLSTMMIRALVLDANGDTVPSYNQPISVTSGNTAAVTVLTPAVLPQGGIAVITLKAGTVPEPSAITVTAPEVGSYTFTITPAGQVGGRLAVTTSTASLPVGGSSGTLTLRLKDAAGQDVYTLTAPMRVQLTTSNPAAAAFPTGGMTEFTMTTPTATVQVTSGLVAGTAVITGTAIRDDGVGIPVEAITILTVIQ